MRTFYIFLIKKHFKILNIHNPYNLYKELETISKSTKYNIDTNMNKFNQLKQDINKELLNNNTYSYYKNKITYTKTNNIHSINNFFTKENTKLIINKTYIVIKTNKPNPSFIEYLKNINNNFFVCDFDNKDYFWLSKI